jgi:hypothetical protein
MSLIMAASLYLCGIHKTCLESFAGLDPLDHCTPALFFRTVTPVLVTIGILAVPAMVVAVIYERVSAILLVFAQH